MTKQLLVDTIQIRISLEEGANGGKLVARGQFAIADKPTANRRRYGRALWERELKRLAPIMAAKKVFGELDHPAEGRTKLQRVSHLLTNLVLQPDGQIIGEAEVMDTTMGKELKAIFDAGGNVGVSSRGYGSVKQDSEGYDEVQDDFQLDTFDFVVDPAQSTAYPEFTLEGQTKPSANLVGEQSPALGEKPEGVPVGEPIVETTKPVVAEEVKGVINWDTLPESVKKEFNARLMTAVAESREAIRVEVKSELLANPAVAGASTTLESLKALLLPYVVPADTAAVVEAKDKEIADLRLKLLAQEGLVESTTKKTVMLTKAVKDLGFNLYLHKNMGDHPKFEEIVKSLGDISMIESLDALKNRVEIFQKEVVKIRTENREASRALLAQKDGEATMLREQVKKAVQNNKKLAADLEEAQKKANEAMTEAYLERKVFGNPNASRIRVKFQESAEKCKATVDALLEGFSKAPVAVEGTRDFDRVRSRIGNANGRVAGNLVENSLAGTVPSKDSKMISVTEDYGLSVKDFQHLAGVV